MSGVRRARVLLIEHDGDHAAQLVHGLCRAGHQVTVAGAFPPSAEMVTLHYSADQFSADVAGWLDAHGFTR